jgi:hypothetical protein
MFIPVHTGAKQPPEFGAISLKMKYQTVGYRP